MLPQEGGPRPPARPPRALVALGPDSNVQPRITGWIGEQSGSLDRALIQGNGPGCAVTGKDGWKRFTGHSFNGGDQRDGATLVRVELANP